MTASLPGRRLGRTNLHVTEIGLGGAWLLGRRGDLPVALRWPSIVVALGFGVAASVTGTLIAQGAYSAGSPRWWVRFFPWSLPANALFVDPSGLWPTLTFASLAGLLLMAVTTWHLSRREVNPA
jgi:hypothetical protein